MRSTPRAESGALRVPLRSSLFPRSRGFPVNRLGAGLALVAFALLGAGCTGGSGSDDPIDPGSGGDGGGAGGPDAETWDWYEEGGSGSGNLGGGSGGDGGDGGGDGGGETWPCFPGGGDLTGGFGYPGGGGSGPPGFEDYAIQYGMNAGFQNWWAREIVFADAMMRAMEFTRVESGIIGFDPAPLIPLGGTPPRLGEGWPDFSQLASGETAGCWLMGSMEGTIPDGRVFPWVVTWEGTGTCRLAGPPVQSEGNSTANRGEFYVDPTVAGGNAELAMFIEASAVHDPVRNVHVWLPLMEEQRPLFWPLYLMRVEAMNHGNGPHTWRTLDWTRVNDYGRTLGNFPFVFDLAGRIKTTSPSQGTMRGMCPEFQVAFCNRIGANLHLSLPHRTADMTYPDYVAFVRDTLVRIRDGSPAVPGVNGGRRFAGLDPELTLILELSNEMWNEGFPVYHWMEKEAARKGISLEAQIATQVRLIFDIADTIFTGDDASRLAKYIGGHLGRPSFTRDVMGFLPPGYEVNALGPACYFGPSPQVISGWMVGANPQTGACPNCPTLAEVLAASRARIEEMRPLVREHRRIADAWVNPDQSRPMLIAYEGGQHIVAGFQPWGDEASAAQVHPHMYAAYVEDLIPLLVAEGVEVIHWYSFMSDQDPSGGNGAGPFGVWNDMAQLITLPVPDPYVHEGIPKASAIYRGPPLL